MKEKYDWFGLIVSLFFIVIIILAFVGLIFTGVFSMIESQKQTRECTKLDYEYYSNTDVEPGYFKCCNKVYLNHIKQDPECIAIKSDWFV